MRSKAIPRVLIKHRKIQTFNAIRYWRKNFNCIEPHNSFTNYKRINPKEFNLPYEGKQKYYNEENKEN